MTEKKYWKRRAELAESVITGIQAADIDLPDGLIQRVWVHQDFIANNKPVTNSHESLELFERAPVSPGVWVLRVPGGYVYEYYNNDGIATAVTFAPL